MEMRLTQTAAARLIGRDARTVRRWIADGLLKTYTGGTVDKAAVVAIAKSRGHAGRKRQPATALWGDARSNERWRKALRRLKDCDDGFSILGSVVFAENEAKALRKAAIRILGHVLKATQPDAPQFDDGSQWELDRETMAWVPARPQTTRPRIPVENPLLKSEGLPDVCKPDDKTGELLALWFCWKHYPGGPAGSVVRCQPDKPTERLEAACSGAQGGILDPLPIEAWLDKQLHGLTAQKILAVAARFVCKAVKNGPAPENWLFPTASEKPRTFEERQAYYERRIGKRPRRETASKRGVTLAGLLGCSRQMARHWRRATSKPYEDLVEAYRTTYLRARH